MRKIANILTGFRILGSVLLLFFPSFSLEFYTIYFFCGFSDMIDGFVARKTNSVSEFGAKFDTVADFLFVIAALIKILPVVNLSLLIWIWCGIIAVVKIGNTVWGVVRYKKLLTQHTVANKVTGLFLFLLPFTFHLSDVQYTVPAVCTVATFSVIQEIYCVFSGREIV